MNKGETMAETEQCPICGGDLKKTTIKEIAQVEGQLVVIENVQAKVCKKCCETIVDYDEMQRIIKEIEEARADYKAGRFKKVQDLLTET